MAAVQTLNPPKASWADEVEEEDNQFQTQTTTDENGVKTIIETKINDDGRKVRITRKIRTKLITERVNKDVAERKKWPKFGDETGNKPGPDMSTTTIGENVQLKLSFAKQMQAEEHAEDDQASVKAALKGKKIMCRICKGDHFTTKCPYKDTLQPLDELQATVESVRGGEGTPERAVTPDSGAQQGGSKYLPPHLRKGASGAGGETMREKRDDSATLRVTNLSEDVVEADVHDLFRRFGPIGRVYLARDRETNLCKGFAFVSFIAREDAARALEAINGYGYDNLILRVEWAAGRN